MTAPAIALPRATGEEDSAKRRQILEGAHRVFMELGFDGASMGEIAKAAGVSKGTLYVYFTDKAQLFEAMVEQQCAVQSGHAINLDPANPDVAAVLTSVGIAHLEWLCRPQGATAIRTVMAIAERMPEIGRRYYENLPAAWIGRLSAYLKAQVAAGRLDIPDCNLAAAQFFQICNAELFLPYVFQAAPVPSRADIERVVASGVKMFLAAYGRKAENA
jgi:AcrR family transcriptional regulator